MIMVLGIAPVSAGAASAPDGVRVILLKDATLADLAYDEAARQLGCYGGGWALVTSLGEVTVDEVVAAGTDPSEAFGGAESIILVAPAGGAVDDDLGVAIAGPRDPSEGGGCLLLRSQGTRRAGIVSPGAIEDARRNGGFGAWLEPTGDPFGTLERLDDLQSRHLQQRGMYVPVGLTAGAATLVVLALALFIYFRRERVGERTRVVGEWACFTVPSMAVGMLACGHLTDLNYFSVGAVIAGSALILPGIALAFRRRGPLAAPFVFGLLLLVIFAVEAAMGWPATLFTLLGGTALDGARFYGLPNAFMGLLLGGALFMAPSLRSVGAPLIVAVGLLAGLPQLGANMGAAITIMFAAGLWIGLTTPGWRGIGAGVIIGAAGLAVVVAAHVMSDAPTHVTALAESGGLDPGSLIDRAMERLGIGIDLLRRSPVGITYLIAAPVVLWFVVKPRGGWREAFEAHPLWRSAMLTILAASIVAYFVNDTGVSAVGQGFAMALGGILYVPIARGRDRIGSR
jgi:hypothetical protein